MNKIFSKILIFSIIFIASDAATKTESTENVGKCKPTFWRCESEKDLCLDRELPTATNLRRSESAPDLTVFEFAETG